MINLNDVISTIDVELEGCYDVIDCMRRTRYENDTKFLSVYEVTYKCKLYKYYKLMVRCLSTPFHEELARWEVNEKYFFCKELRTWGELLMNTVE